MVRCVLDSLACKYRRTLERAEALVRPAGADVVHLVGGGAANALLCQLTADVTGRPVVAGPEEATGVGNLLIQAWPTGGSARWPSCAPWSRASLPPRRYEPRRRGRSDRRRVRRFDRVSAAGSTRVTETF